MKVLFASRFVDPFPVASNNNVYLQAKSLKEDFGVDVEILTWPTNDGWTGEFPTVEKQHPPIKLERAGLNYQVFVGPGSWDVPAGGAILSDGDWEQAVQYGMEILMALRPDIVHLQHRHGFWWILESAQRLGIPNVYSNHDWGIACQRTVLVKGDGTLCDGVVGTGKCADCVRTGRRSALGQINEILVSTRFGEFIARLALNSPLKENLRKRGIVNESSFKRAAKNHQRATGVISHLDHCFTPSLFGKRFFSQLGCPAGQITILPWYCQPVDTQKTVQSNNPFTITYVGRVAPEKGVHQIFQALEKVMDYESVILRVAGANESDYCRALKAKYPKTVGIHGVEWLGWSQVEHLFKSTDCSIIPSLCIDNTPLTLTEAMAYRVPVIATRVPPIEELVCEGESGFFAEYRSIDSLADAIRRAIRKKDDIRGDQLHFPSVLGIQEYMAKVVGAYRAILSTTNQ